MSTLSAVRRLVKKVHRDERGAVSLETILIIGAIALPILIFVVKYGWLSDLSGLEDSLKGFAVCGGLMLVCFVFFGIGGGDVKLIAMMGAFLGFYRGVEALLWTFVLGAAAGLAILIWRVGLWRLIT